MVDESSDNREGAFSNTPSAENILIDAPSKHLDDFPQPDGVIPPGKEPVVFDMETGLGMKEPWAPRFAKDG